MFSSLLKCQSCRFNGASRTNRTNRHTDLPLNISLSIGRTFLVVIDNVIFLNRLDYLDFALILHSFRLTFI